LVTPGETGFVFPLGDVHALATLLCKCDSNCRELEQIGRRARQRVARYSVSSAVDGLLEAVSAVNSDKSSARA
jgi:glycosyltransferase involved in cell wall biosynthesis